MSSQHPDGQLQKQHDTQTQTIKDNKQGTCKSHTNNTNDTNYTKLKSLSIVSYHIKLIPKTDCVMICLFKISKSLQTEEIDRQSVWLHRAEHQKYPTVYCPTDAHNVKKRRVIKTF